MYAFKFSSVSLPCLAVYFLILHASNPYHNLFFVLFCICYFFLHFYLFVFFSVYVFHACLSTHHLPNSKTFHNLFFVLQFTRYLVSFSYFYFFVCSPLTFLCSHLYLCQFASPIPVCPLFTCLSSPSIIVYLHRFMFLFYIIFTSLPVRLPICLPVFLTYMSSVYRPPTYLSIPLFVYFLFKRPPLRLFTLPSISGVYQSSSATCPKSNLSTRPSTRTYPSGPSRYLFPPLVSVARSGLHVNPLEEAPQDPLSYLAVINGTQVTPSPCVDY